MDGSDSDTGAAAPVLKPSSPFLQIFWDLAVIDSVVREDAVTRLLAHLADAQGKFEELARTVGGGETGGDDTPAVAPSQLCGDVDYAVKRYVEVWQ